MVDVGYGGCKPRIKGIDKCQYRFCTILGIIKIIKRGSVGAGGLDLTKNHLKMKKKTKKEEKKRKKKFVFGAGFEPTTLRLQILHLTP